MQVPNLKDTKVIWTCRYYESYPNADLILYQNKYTGLYHIQVETIYEFHYLDDACWYLEFLLNRFTEFFKENYSEEFNELKTLEFYEVFDNNSMLETIEFSTISDCYKTFKFKCLGFFKQCGYKFEDELCKK